jgi:hypothetical protein
VKTLLNTVHGFCIPRILTRLLIAGLALPGLGAWELPAQPALQIRGVQPTNHPVIGPGRALRFTVQGTGSNGLVEIESTSALGAAPVWATRSAAPAAVLNEAPGFYDLSFSSNDVPAAAFFRYRHFTGVDVRHPFPGSLPRLLGGVGYGVDEESAFTLTNLGVRVSAAPGLAFSNNAAYTGSSSNGAAPRVFTPFHYWPNVIDLALVHAGDPVLYSNIVGQILASEPDRSLIETQWLADVTQGRRLFLARDFLNTVSVGTSTWAEVHFAMAINLDSLSVRELQVHGLRAEGMVQLHDPRVDALRSSMTNAASLPEGEVWCLCLRGNYRRSFFQAVVVDKVISLAGAALHIVQIDQSCSGGGGGGPPPTEDPPEEPPPPVEPPPPGGGGDGSNGERAWSAARLPPVRGGQAPGRVPVEDIPNGPNQPGQRNPQQPIPGLAQEQAKIQMLLDQARQNASQLRANYVQDAELLRNMSYVWIGGVLFTNPCLQSNYSAFAAEVAAVQAQIAPLQAEASNCVVAIKNATQSASPPIRALVSKPTIWINVVDGYGPWSNLQIPCSFPIIPSAGTTEIVGLGVDRFAREVVLGMMQGKSWTAAVDAAVANPRNYPGGVAMSQDAVFTYALRQYADCLRQLYEAKFRIALAQFYPGLTAAERESMIPVLFDCDRDFTPAQRSELAALQALITAANTKIDGLLAQIAALEDQINRDILRRFHAAAADCLRQAAAQVLNADNIRRILEAALVEATTPGAPGSVPSYPDIGPDHGRAAFCQALQQLLASPAVQNCPGLAAYITSLLQGTCGP